VGYKRENKSFSKGGSKKIKMEVIFMRFMAIKNLSLHSSLKIKKGGIRPPSQLFFPFGNH
jgi:hypothetical protein